MVLCGLFDIHPHPLIIVLSLILEEITIIHKPPESWAPIMSWPPFLYSPSGALRKLIRVWVRGGVRVNVRLRLNAREWISLGLAWGRREDPPTQPHWKVLPLDCSRLPLGLVTLESQPQRRPPPPPALPTAKPPLPIPKDPGGPTTEPEYGYPSLST